MNDQITRTQCSSGKPRQGRRGLAPLELVLAIPLVLFVVALSVIMGTVSCWKVRAHGVARDAIFGRRFHRYWHRGEPADPQPPEWRVANAAHGDQGGPALNELDNPVFENPLLRGPLPGISVNSEMLDPTNHARVGSAQLTRAPPALRRLGNYSLDVRELLLDGKWQYWQLGYAGNRSRRLRQLYDLLNLPAAAGMKAQYQRAQQHTISTNMRPEMFVLDRDDEFIAWRGWAPDFHPSRGMPCTLDTELMEQSVQRLLTQIDGQPRQPRDNSRGVPENMASAFLGMYRQQLAVLESMPPPLTAAQQARIAELKQKIEILKAFLATLN
jgi:hypothetical protein